MDYPYGIHFAVVRVDRGTGAVAVERYFVGYDIGKAVNPMLVEGQIAGGVAQGIGGALFEEFLYDPRGEPLCVSFADYLMPTAREIAPIEVLITEDAPSPLNSLGIKGAGEGGVNAVGAAIAAAIDDALGRPGAVTELPVTPAAVAQHFAGRSDGPLIHHLFFAADAMTILIAAFRSGFDADKSRPMLEIFEMNAA